MSAPANHAQPREAVRYVLQTYRWMGLDEEQDLEQLVQALDTQLHTAPGGSTDWMDGALEVLDELTVRLQSHRESSPMRALAYNAADAARAILQSALVDGAQGVDTDSAPHTGSEPYG